MFATTAPTQRRPAWVSSSSIAQPLARTRATWFSRRSSWIVRDPVSGKRGGVALNSSSDKFRQKRFTGAAEAGGKSPADLRDHPERIVGLDLIDENDVGAFEHDQVGGFAALLIELDQVRVGDALRRRGRCRPCCRARTGLRPSRYLPVRSPWAEEAAVGEGGEETGGPWPAEVELAGELGNAALVLATQKRLEQVDRAIERLNRVMGLLALNVRRLRRHGGTPPWFRLALWDAIP